MLLKFIVCLLAGLGAGLGTGFAGMSAATVIAPMLVVFLGFPAYQSVGIALASDVLASASCAYTYGKNKHIDLMHGLVMLASVLVFTMVGSGVAYLISRSADGVLGNFSVIMALVLGIKFLIRPVTATREERQLMSQRKKILQSLVSGIYIGFVCGFMGAGGGLMMLFVLTSVLGYELKTAVGTSVFIMTFTALTGALSHFVSAGVYDWTALILCVIFTLLGAQWASHYANRASNATLNRATGVVLTMLGVVMLVVKFFI
jgi:hypothetical protein